MRDYPGDLELVYIVVSFAFLNSQGVELALVLLLEHHHH